MLINVHKTLQNVNDVNQCLFVRLNVIKTTYVNIRWHLITLNVIQPKFDHILLQLGHLMLANQHWLACDNI